MTTLTNAPTTRSAIPIGVFAATVAIGFTVLGAHDWGEIAVVATGIAVVTALVYGVVVPRALRKESAGGTGLALSIPALLLVVPAFWSGLPLVFGAAGFLIGQAGRRARSGAGQAMAATVLGALAVVGYVFSYVSDAASGGLGFLFA
jgi:hypothetical protein